MRNPVNPRPKGLRGRLLKEARDMLAANDGEDFSLRSVAKRAAIAPASVYHHYEGKSDLLSELAALGFWELRAEISDALATVSRSAMLRTWAAAYGSYARREPAVFALMFDRQISERAAPRAAREEMLDDLRRLVVASGRDRGLVGGPQDVACTVWAIAHGAATLTQVGAVSSLEQLEAGLAALNESRHGGEPGADATPISYPD